MSVYALAMACVLNTSTCEPGYFLLDKRSMDECQNIILRQIDGYRVPRRDRSVVLWHAQSCSEAKTPPQNRKFMGMI